MKYPTTHTAMSIKQWGTRCEIREGIWIPARGLAKNNGFLNRIKLAYFVFIGKYDALDWQDYERL